MTKILIETSPSIRSRIKKKIIRQSNLILRYLFYSGGQNIVDTLYMFYLYALTLGANNF